MTKTPDDEIDLRTIIFECQKNVDIQGDGHIGFLKIWETWKPEDYRQLAVENDVKSTTDLMKALRTAADAILSGELRRRDRNA